MRPKLLEQRSSSTTTSSTAKSRIPPTDVLVPLDPYDLRKDKIVPLFSPDRSSFNSAIKFDEPLTVEYIQRVYNEEYSDEEGDLANIIFSDIEEPEYSNNLTVFERFLGSETESNGETYFNPMPVEAPQS